MIILTMTALLAACTPGGSDAEQNIADDETPAPGAATGESPTGYPAPQSESGYPAPPAELIMPTGYPDVTVVAPSGEVDLGSLTPVTPELTPQVMPSPGRPDLTPIPEIAPLVEATARDLNAQTDVPTDEIHLLSAEPTTWPDGGLGCPAEGVSYTQALVEGYLLVLEAAGQTYAYHTDGAQNFVLCQDGKPVSSGSVP
jgi:hypothetical protein